MLPPPLPPLTVAATDPRYIEALWQLHKEKGGGYHREEEIQQRAREVVLRPKLPPPLPPRLPL